ncbi:hypothetical protein KSS93_25230 [Pseudomonas xanthosomatis]|uniref:DUF6543 domain-containing protein n=1 Tax=Pseudomonas xanthosomatis TaxID=2842356 RepID=UPI001C3DD523|nr:DUF6543 domain-containing protein [Pseudomonas xanthosomatis]QXH46130.1 hypothetical protein KSS93_25230 [Pseudomonas xanthosomatis]
MPDHHSPSSHADDHQLNDAQSYLDQQVLLHIEQNLNDYFGPLGAAERQRYLQLANNVSSANQYLTETLADCMQAFEQIGMDKLRYALQNLSTTTIDPATWYFHTRITLVPARQPRALDNREPRSSIQSFTLWEAARLDLSYAYPPSYQNRYLEHSYVSRYANGTKEKPDILSAEAFERHAHALDLGKVLHKLVDGVMNLEFRKKLGDYHHALFELAAYDAVRASQDHDHAARLPAILSAAFNDAAQPWTQYQLSFAGQSFPLPLFSRSFAQPGIKQTASYYPNRTGGAVALHFNQHLAAETLLEQIKNNPDERWFLDGLSQQAQNALAAHLKIRLPNRDKLSWVHQQLFDLLGEGVPPKQKLLITPIKATLPLRQALIEQHVERIRKDLLASAVTASERRWKALADSASIVLNETLGMLTLAVPGGVLGANRLMLTATLGTLTYQAISAAAALRHGERAEAVQALTDISDLLISARLQSVAGKVSRRRARQLVQALNNPRVVEHDGQATLSWPDVTGTREGAHPSAMDVSGIDQVQLLQRLLPRSSPAITPAQAERLLALAGISLSALQDIWYRQGDTPWQLQHLLQEQALLEPRLPDETDTLAKRFPGLSAPARAFLLALHPQLRSVADGAVLPNEQLQSILHVWAEQRAINAVRAFDMTALPAHPDSEALFCSMLLCDPAWPAELGIDIQHGQTDHSGLVTPGQQRLASYGLDGAQQFITLYRAQQRYAGSLDTGDLIQVEPGQSGLAQAILRTLDDTQRQALGIDIHAPGSLIDRAIHRALVQRAVLADLLPAPDHYPLSQTRLEPFRQGTLPVSATPGADGIYRIGQKLYIQIEQNRYQVLQDTDASSPQRPVWRIVRGSDPVAQAPDNRYVATRVGRSEPVSQDANGNWQGVLVGGLAGMRKNRLADLRAQNQKAKAEQQQQAQMQNAREFKELNDRNNAIVDRLEQFTLDAAKINTLTETPDLGRMQAMQRLIAHVDDIEAQLALFREQPRFVQQNMPGLDVSAFTCTQQIEQLHQLRRWLLVRDLALGDALQRLRLERDAIFTPAEIMADPAVARNHRLAHRERLKTLIHRLPKATRFANILQQVLDSPAYDHATHTLPGKVIPVSEIMFGIIHMRGLLLAFSDTHNLDAPCVFRPEVKQLSIALLRESHVYHYVKESTAGSRFTVIMTLQQQFEALADSFEQLRPDFPEHAPDHNAEHLQGLLTIVNDYREDCDRRLLEILQKDESSPLPSDELTDIDFDFIPSQETATPSNRARRVISIQRHGRSRLVQAEQRGDSPDRLTLLGTDEQATPLEATRTAPGTWQLTPAPPARTLDQLNAAASSRLAALDKLTSDARARGQRKNAVAANITEPLLDHADELDILATQYQEQNLPARPEQHQQLIDASARLRRLANDLTLQIYKNPLTPNASYLTYLLEKQEVKVRKVQQARQRVGKGNNLHFMDNYLIMDNSGQALWEAHFHYPGWDTPRENYAHRSGHLKTLEDARKGIQFQMEQERLGHKVPRILRVEVPVPLARSIFELADQHHASTPSA